jgi:hypothetical protein
MEINFSVLVAAVFCGNVFTAIFLWGVSRASRAKKGEEADLPWLVLMAFTAPPALFVLTLIAAGSQLPLVGAVFAR